MLEPDISSRAASNVAWGSACGAGGVTILESMNGGDTESVRLHAHMGQGLRCVMHFSHALFFTQPMHPLVLQSRMQHPLPWLSASLLALFLSGCDIPAPHVSTHAQLHIAADGSLALDQQPLAPGALLAQLQARKAKTPDVLVEIHASPKADMAVIRGAIATIKQAKARLSFDDEFPASAVDKRDVPADL